MNGEHVILLATLFGLTGLVIWLLLPTPEPTSDYSKVMQAVKDSDYELTLAGIPQALRDVHLTVNVIEAAKLKLITGEQVNTIINTVRQQRVL